MKKMILGTLVCMTAVLTYAQNNATVTYTETRKLHINIEGDMPMPPGLPTENKNHTILYLNNTASLYMNDLTKQSDPMRVEEESGEGENIIFRMDAPDNRTYCDLVNKQLIRQEDFMQRKFLVEADMNSGGWKITGKQKMILNYPCTEAVKEDSLQRTVAWFTPAIPVSSGPQEYVGLPGLVMEVNIGDGEQVITATGIVNEVDASKIEKPKEGKKVTEEEFNAIVEEKMKEMGIERGEGGANVIIRIEED